MPKTTEKLDFPMGDNGCRPTAFLRAMICVLGDFGGNICKKRLQFGCDFKEDFDIVVALEGLAA